MSATRPVVGILALQGDYQKHQQALDRLAVSSCPVRSAADLARIDRLIIPGGESTVIADLLQRFAMREALAAFLKSHPVWGTCAGMVLLAAQVNDQSVTPFGAIDIAVDRNGYGRQYFSDVVPGRVTLNAHEEHLDLVFIRAPRVTRVGRGVTVLLTRDHDPVLLQQNNVLVSAFHPELTVSLALHRYFVHTFAHESAR